MFHFIFDYNYGSLWQILVIVLPQETEMNTPPEIAIITIIIHSPENFVQIGWIAFEI